MSRLIDADALKRDMEEYLQRIPCDNAPPRSAVVHCRILLDEQPTAYDVEEVVEELEESSIEFELFGRCVVFVSLAAAIDIVKRGGVDE